MARRKGRKLNKRPKGRGIGGGRWKLSMDLFQLTPRPVA